MTQILTTTSNSETFVKFTLSAGVLVPTTTNVDPATAATTPTTATSGTDTVTTSGGASLLAQTEATLKRFLKQIFPITSFFVNVPT